MQKDMDSGLRSVFSLAAIGSKLSSSLSLSLSILFDFPQLASLFQESDSVKFTDSIMDSDNQIYCFMTKPNVEQNSQYFRYSWDSDNHIDCCVTTATAMKFPSSRF